MNIGKKMYLSFGIILATVLVLLAINLIAVQREHETKAAAHRSIDMTEATSSVRFRMMQNRLHLQNYLLSGDTRDVEKMSSAVLHEVDRENRSDAPRELLVSAGMALARV
jgi:CHASE3 domain sensor protein